MPLIKHSCEKLDNEVSWYDNTLGGELMKHIYVLNMDVFLVLLVYNYIYVQIILLLFKFLQHIRNKLYSNLSDIFKHFSENIMGSQYVHSTN
jgi:hypothetical protein